MRIFWGVSYACRCGRWLASDLGADAAGGECLFDERGDAWPKKMITDECFCVGFAGMSQSVGSLSNDMAKGFWHNN